VRQVICTQDTPDDLLDYDRLLADASDEEPEIVHMVKPSDNFVLQYTGGTTGRPKGPVHSHETWVRMAYDLNSEVMNTELGDVTLHCAPLTAAASAFVLGVSIAGATHVLLRKFDPIEVFETIQRHKVTQTMLVPTMVQMVVDHPELKQHDMRSLTHVIYGASPIGEGLLDRAMQAFPEAGFTQAYGMTELSPVATLLTREMHTEVGRAKGRHRGAGRAVIGTEVRIVDADDREVPRGEVGEVVVRGPGVMMGYWNKPAETEAALRGGWMHTGDGGRMDEDGYIYIVDRMKDMIVTGGENVYSVETESAVATHPAVAVCAVIGVPSEQWGEAVHAFVILKAGQSATPEELIAHAKTRIAAYKCPRTIDFIDAMPLSGAGKVLKTTLRAPFWAHHDRKVG